MNRNTLKKLKKVAEIKKQAAMANLSLLISVQSELENGILMLDTAKNILNLQREPDSGKVCEKWLNWSSVSKNDLKQQISQLQSPIVKAKSEARYAFGRANLVRDLLQQQEREFGKKKARREDSES